MTLPYKILTDNGFDLIEPNQAIIKKNANGLYKVFYQSNRDATEWIEDIDQPEIKVQQGNKETIYTTTITIINQETKKNVLLLRREKEEEGTIEYEMQTTNKNPPGKYFGTQPPKKDNYKVEGVEENLSELTNWKTIAAIINEKNPFYYDHSLMWWRWNQTSKSWEQTDETDLLIVIDKVSKKNTLAPGEKAKALEAFKRIGRLDAPETINDYWVQFGETIVDVTTGERFLATPRYFVTNPIPWNLGTDVSTPKIDALLHEWAGEKAHTLKQILAFSTLPSYAIQRIFFLLGGGSNGKSTYLSLLRKFIGLRNISSQNLDAITNSNDKFASSALYKKLVCEMGETNFTSLKSTEQLKKLSGRDLIKCEFKGKQGFEYINYAKIIIASNSIPETHDKTDGFFRRFVIVDFPNQYAELRDVLAEIPDEEYSNLALWSVVELGSLLRTRSFYLEGSIENRKLEYEKKSDPLTAFIKDYWVTDSGSEVQASEFHAEYEKYLGSRGMRIITYRVWRAEMLARGYEFERHRPFGYENPVQFVLGLRRRTESADTAPLGSNKNNDKNDFESSDNKSVRDVPLVPDLLLYGEKSIENRTSSTGGTSRTNDGLFINDVKKALLTYNKDNISILEHMFGKTKLDQLIISGDMIELPAGTYRII